MAGDWIKVENVTPDKPEVFQIAEKMNIDPDAVVGKLLRIWIWADQQTTDGNAVGVTRTLLDRLAGVAGFADALIDAKWLKEKSGGLEFVNFQEHNGETAKKRAVTARRVARHRSKKDKSNAGESSSVTQQALQQRYQEKELEKEDSSLHDDTGHFSAAESFRMHDGFTVTGRTIQAGLFRAGIPSDFLDDGHVAEFVAYWKNTPRQETQDGWEAALLSRVIKEHRKRSHGDQASRSTGAQSNSEDVGRALGDHEDRTWAAGR